MRRRVGALGVALLLAACSGGGGDGDGSTAGTSPPATATGGGTDDGATTTTGDTTTTTAADDGTTTTLEAVDASLDDLAGNWQSSYGFAVFRVDGDRAIGVYDTDAGTITLRAAGDGVFEGWWTETPSRQPDDDAGNIRVRAVEGADGNLFFSGEWSYGDVEPDGLWVFTPTEDPPPAGLAERLDDASSFVDHP